MSGWTTPRPMTEKQRDYIGALQRKLRLPDRSLDLYCQERYGLTLAELTVADASKLLDVMVGWEDIPADLKRAAGQTDLPGFEALA